MTDKFIFNVVGFVDKLLDNGIFNIHIEQSENLKFYQISSIKEKNLPIAGNLRMRTASIQKWIVYG